MFNVLLEHLKQVGTCECWLILYDESAPEIAEVYWDRAKMEEQVKNLYNKNIRFCVEYLLISMKVKIIYKNK